jgi:heterodisulfide reductase subunit C2
MEKGIEKRLPHPPSKLPVLRQLIGGRGDHFLKSVEGETSANISACYQCERCTNACPVNAYMDVNPHQVIRYVQLGWREELLKSTTIWVCLSCEMCTTYCPNDVDVAKTINHMRNMAFRSTVVPAEKILAVFHETFVNQLQRFGRVNEFWLIGALNRHPDILKEKIKTGDLKEEMALGLEMFRKGKLKLLPRRCSEMKKIREICRKENRGTAR